MIALIQRVQHASVCVNQHTIASIMQGMMVLVGCERGDDTHHAEKLADKLLNYRIFTDHQGKMNLSVKQIEGSVLLVPQFTLAANTQKGNRPSFDPALAPAQAMPLFEYFFTYCQQHYPHIQTGQFGADMQVHLCNDGPVTFWLHIPPNP